MGAKYLMYSERLRRSSNKQRTVKERKKEKVAKKIAAEKVLTFADAMPNCGIWIEDEHAFDPSEVDGSNLDCME
jgi:4'-phosphopantetheinyl transferase EntD